MNCLTIDNPVLTKPSEFNPQSPQSRGLTARWFTVNGKLICKWSSAEGKDAIS